MAVVAEVRLSGKIVFGETLRSTTGAILENQYQATADSLTVAVEGDFEEVEAALKADPTVTAPRTIADLGDRRVYRVEVDVGRDIFSEAAAELNVQVISARGEDGAWTVRVRAPDRAALSRLQQFCEDNDVAFRVERVYTEHESDRGSPLTPAQRELLATAHRMGYFDEPRGASLAEVADGVGISSSAASGRLRRAIRTLVETSTVGDDVK